MICQARLSTGRVTTPAIWVLLDILIGKDWGVSPAMQVEGDHIGSHESVLRQVGEEEFVDQARAGEAHAALFLGSWMGRHHHAAPLLIRSHRDVRTVVERAHQLTFGAAELLIGGQVPATPGPRADPTRGSHGQRTTNEKPARSASVAPVPYCPSNRSTTCSSGKSWAELSSWITPTARRNSSR